MTRLVPFVVIVFAIAAIFLYVKPTWSGSIADTRQQIDSYNRALEAADRFEVKQAELTQAKARIPAESLARLDAFLPDGVDNVQLILDLDALAARSGMTLSDFDIKTESGSTDISTSALSASTSATGDEYLDSTGLSDSSPVESLNLTFKAKGTYPAFRSFLSAMENSLRPLDVVDFNVGESDTGVYDYEVSVRIYWLR